jgi:membrane fusion protein, multidrug efflux system
MHEKKIRMTARILFVALATLMLTVVGIPTEAQTPSRTEEGDPAQAPPEQVIVEREAINVINPEKYQIPLQLKPSQFVTVVSPRHGVIDDLNIKPGSTLTPQSEIFRLKNEAEALLVKRAEATVALQQLKLEQSKRTKEADQITVAEAELKVANVELELAKFHLEQAVRRTELRATVLRVYAIEGEFVTANQKIADLGDPSVMVIEIPVNREDAKEGESVSFMVEEKEIEGKVVAVLPPAERFEPLRDLYDSLASAVVEVENRSGIYKAGQAVYVPAIPRDNVAEVANTSITAGEDGKRKVQVIRENVVRDLLITVLAPIGADRSYISGPFQQGDELILTTSQPLSDGTQLAPRTASDTPATGTATPGATRKPSTGF